MKKKISLLLCLTITAIVCLTGCGKTKTTLEYDEAAIEQQTEFLIHYCQNVDEDTMAQWDEQNEFSKEYQFMMSGLKFTPESFDSAIEGWKAGIKECGDYVSHGDYTFTAKDDELDVSVPAKFKDRNAKIEFVFDENLYLDSMTVSAEFTTAEILEKAGLNTLLGMGTVFVVLIFISFLISLFKYIPALQNAFSKKKKEDEKEVTVAETTAVEEVDVTDDLELIAVISAAIAAAQETTTDGFVVRSIKRRPSNKWNS